MDAFTHFAEGALPNGLPHHVITDEAAVGRSTFLAALRSLLPVTFFSGLARLLIVGQRLA